MTGYVIEYCYCAIAFILVVLWNCFTTRQFPSFSFKLFRAAMVCSLIYVISDAVGANTIQMATTIPLWVNYAINMLYYCLQCVISTFLLILVLALAGFRQQKIPYFTMIPFFLSELIVLTNPFHSLLFIVDFTSGYRLGPLFNVVYTCDFLYIIASLIVINVYKKRITKKQYSAITAFVIIVIAAILIQYFNPRILLSSPAVAISVTLLYLTIQKPEDMLDVNSGVFNRTAMMRMVDTYITSRRDFQATLIVLKNVSRLDRMMGYESLNSLMSEIGRFLSTSFQRTMAFRLSGSTLFAVFTQGNADYENVVSGMRKRFENAWLTKEYNIVLPVSILGLPNTSMVKSADEFSLLINYISENADDETTAFFGEETYKIIQRRQYIENALQSALEQNLFEIYLQPIFSLKERSFTHAEALLRFSWNGETISPSEFIPIAEQNGLIQRIDMLVFDKVCAFLRSIAGKHAGALCNIGINLSALEFMRPDLLTALSGVIEKYGLDPGTIALEMTETAASGSLSETDERMRLLKSYGFKLTLDDFGTGFANITQVVHLPFDTAKLDRSILLGGIKDERGLSVMRHSISMFKEMGIGIIAEGAETANDVSLLESMGVNYIQGFYYARPMPIGSFLRFIADDAASTAL